LRCGRESRRVAGVNQLLTKSAAFSHHRCVDNRAGSIYV
jgi:hypothetical protein